MKFQVKRIGKLLHAYHQHVYTNLAQFHWQDHSLCPAMADNPSSLLNKREPYILIQCVYGLHSWKYVF